MDFDHVSENQRGFVPGGLNKNFELLLRAL